MIDLVKSYRGKRVLVTGSVGFKGKHLVAALHRLGASVVGFDLQAQATEDVRSLSAVLHVVTAWKPEVIFHLAAQAFVPVGFEAPALTFETNVTGTVNVLEAVRLANRPCAVVVVTTDKVYGDTGPHYAGEDERLFGSCPYSASKVAAEFAVEAYRESFFKGSEIAVATARAGNVIGPGDHGRGRLVPSAVQALREGRPIPIFHPEAVRPWQYVEDVIDGYLRLGAALTDPDRHGFARAWNFGPLTHHSVLKVVEQIIRAWGSGTWALVHTELREMTDLRIDSADARWALGWDPQWTFERMIEDTIAWYKVNP